MRQGCENRVPSKGSYRSRQRGGPQRRAPNSQHEIPPIPQAPAENVRRRTAIDRTRCGRNSNLKHVPALTRRRPPPLRRVMTSRASCHRNSLAVRPVVLGKRHEGARDTVPPNKPAPRRPIQIRRVMSDFGIWHPQAFPPLRKGGHGGWVSLSCDTNRRAA